MAVAMKKVSTQLEESLHNRLQSHLSRSGEKVQEVYAKALSGFLTQEEERAERKRLIAEASSKFMSQNAALLRKLAE